MRIALVSETWAPEVNGVAHTLHHLASHLVAKGVTLQLIRPRPRGGERETLVERDVHVRSLALPIYADVHVGVPCRRRLRSLWERERPDAIYIATEGPLGWSALNAARQMALPVVSGFHTNFDQYAHNYHLAWSIPMARAGLRLFHNRCDATLVPTATQRDALAAQGYDNVAVLARGVDAERYTPARRDKALRARWGAGEHQPVALYAGRLAAEKNIELLAETMAAMQRANPALIQVMVGDGPARKRLQQRLPDAVFTGFLTGEALARHYASADLFIFPSLSETFGNVVPEAMASGLAVVAFEHAAAKELITDGLDGRLVALDQSEGFVQTASDLCRHPAQIARLGRQARTRAASLRWDRIGDQFLAHLIRVQSLSHAATHTTSHV
ncbi:glycosyltransferase family 4 protein [Salinicola rhizosphaerae]|uniref:Glycosyl transferase n=1 Tax=Salinicola rhizosphaerae TaxID=1443141 RepID=A0ABQ3DNT0_9GAMM|nr:glycosyltransferase family 1 protein [Salinicola rhizosphaerae]GHB09629.1 glycosyl transferase [Salinicola rhizosphaerae]